MDYSRDTNNQRTLDPVRSIKESAFDSNGQAQFNNYLVNGTLGQTGRGILSSRDQQDLTMFKSKMSSRLAAAGPERAANGGALSPQPVSDYAQGFSAGGNALGSKDFIVANAMGFKPYKPSETPQHIRQNDLTNYMNWVPTKEKLNLQSLATKKGNKLSPLRAGPGSHITEDDRRSQMSKTVLQVRDKFSYSQAGDALNDISVDGISINAQKIKPRALSNLRTISGYRSGFNGGMRIPSQNMTPGIMSPAPRRNILDELTWEDRHKVLNFSLAKINSLKKEDLLKAINLPDASPMQAKITQIRRFGDEASTIDEALKKLARLGDDHPSMKDWARTLIKKFDKNMDGIISFQELCDGLNDLNISLALKDRVALMKKLDMNRDGEISDIEMYRALSSVEPQLTKETVDQALKKIASGAADSPNLKEYVKSLMKRFDSNHDGLISVQELAQGLKKLGINLNTKEINSLMEKLDLNRDGQVSEQELFKVLQGVEYTAFPRSGVNISVEQALKKLASGAETFSNIKEYVRFLIKQFDGNADGIITFDELTTGLRSLGINLNLVETQALMKKLDINKDGKITEEELLKVLSGQTGDIVPPALLPQVIDQALKKIAGGADDFSDMRGYAKALVKRFDRNQDGHVQFKELCEGLKTMNIFLTQREREGLMKKLDTNQDGSISGQELYKAIASINIDTLKQMAKESAEVALKKIASGAEDFPNLREYIKFLMRKFDSNDDGCISFEELANGVKTLHINLTRREKLSLMKKLDLNRDGEITAEELYKTLSKVDTKLTKTQVDASIQQVLRKIASGADSFGNLKEYVRTLVTRFDQNSDGLISFEELCSGLHHFRVNLNAQERAALMRRLDFNRDGDITIDEIYNTLRPYGESSSQNGSNFLSSKFNSSRRSPTISPDMVSFKQKELERISIDEIINKVKKGAQKYPSQKHFVSAIMRRYDTDGDGYLNFRELSEGLDADNMGLTQDEKLRLMKHLDVDCDGVISRDEIFDALLIDSRHKRNHHHPQVNIDHLLKRIRQGAEKFKTLNDFVRFLFEKLDTDGSGALSFNELSVGLTNMGIDISQKEKHALMKKLDSDADGEICYDEFYKGLAEVGKFKQPTDLNASQALNVDHALKKIAIGAEQYKCLEDYIIMLFKKFDVNKDGALSFKEMREGLRSLNVHLSDNEIHALFHLVDVDRDGEITQEELYNAVLTKEKFFNKNPRIGQQKVNVDHVLNLIKKGVEKYSSLDEYVKALMERFDINGDGSISIDELSEGLKSINVTISDKEKLALMKELDKDRDGGISQQELYNALSTSAKPARAFSTSPTRKLPGFKGQALSGIDNILIKIRKAVSHYKSMQEQIIGLLRIFDLDNDGLISYLELVDGVKALGIQAKKADMIDLMNRIDTDKDGFITQIELYKALDLKPQHAEYQGTSVSIDQVLVKLRRGSEKYHSLTEYVNYLFEQFATSNSAFMTFQELMNCLKTFNFNLTQVERIALMKRMDENGDNQISKEEFYNALATAGQMSSERHSPRPGVSAAPIVVGQDSEEARVDHAMKKIKQGAAKFKTLQEYVKYLMKRFDVNKDGFLTYIELTEGLREMDIKIFKGEQMALMRRVDEDRDGFVSYDELLRALSRI